MELPQQVAPGPGKTTLPTSFDRNLEPRWSSPVSFVAELLSYLHDQVTWLFSGNTSTVSVFGSSEKRSQSAVKMLCAFSSECAHAATEPCARRTGSRGLFKLLLHLQRHPNDQELQS